VSKRKVAGTSSVDVDALINSATEAAAQFGWTTWVPDARDQVIVPAIQPPLTFSMVLQYANLRAWLDRQALTQSSVDAVTNELAAAWWNARMTGVYSGVADVLRDLMLWNVIVRMSPRDADAVRMELARRRQAASAPSIRWTSTPAPSPPPATRAPDKPVDPSPPSVTKKPRVTDARKDWAREHSPAYTRMYEIVMLRMGPWP
jgi:hypothetical protein